MKNGKETLKSQAPYLVQPLFEMEDFLLLCLLLSLCSLYCFPSFDCHTVKDFL